MLLIVNEYIESKITVNTDGLFLDGTKLEANANKFTFVWRKTAQKSLNSNYVKFWSEMDSFTEYCAENGISFSFSKVTVPTPLNAYEALNKVAVLCNIYASLR